MPRSSSKHPALVLLGLSISLTSPLLSAGTPAGWISGDLVHAYTQDAGSLELTLEKTAVNDTIDFLDIRDDLIAGNRRLVDDSGDLDGWQGTLRLGLLDTLALYYKRQAHDLTLKLGPISSLDIVDIDQALQTTLDEAGLKWTFYQADFLSSNGELTAASLELAWLRNESKDFSLAFDSMHFNSGNTSATVSFTETQTAGIENLEDEGWRARLVYTTQLVDNLVASAWAGYSAHEAASGTGSSVPIASLREALTQHFAVDEKHLMLGAGFNWQITPRLPLQLSYEYIRIDSQRIDITRGSDAGFALPSFLSASSLSSDDANHTLSGSLSWWATPALNLGITGKLFSNQFLGVMPHYNNPLSASFSDAPYGYIGLRMGMSLGK